MIRPEDIRDLLRKSVFQPFRMHMSNGQFFDVRHPNLALVTREIIIVARRWRGDNDPIGDGFHLVSVSEIKQIEILPKDAATKKS